MNDDNVTYFHSFGAEHVPEETKKLIGNKYIATNTYRIRANDSIMDTIMDTFVLGLLILC